MVFSEIFCLQRSRSWRNTCQFRSFFKPPIFMLIPLSHMLQAINKHCHKAFHASFDEFILFDRLRSSQHFCCAWPHYVIIIVNWLKLVVLRIKLFRWKLLHRCILFDGQTCSNGCGRPFPLSLVWVKAWRFWSFILLLLIFFLFLWHLMECRLQIRFLHGTTWSAEDWIREGAQIGGDLGLMHTAVVAIGLWWSWRVWNETDCT